MFCAYFSIPSLYFQDTCRIPSSLRKIGKAYLKHTQSIPNTYLKNTLTYLLDRQHIASGYVQDTFNGIVENIFHLGKVKSWILVFRENENPEIPVGSTDFYILSRYLQHTQQIPIKHGKNTVHIVFRYIKHTL